MRLNRGAVRLAVWLLTVLVAFPAGAAPLFEVLGERNRIVILGSIHYLRAEDAVLPAAVTRALAEADAVYMELDMDSLDAIAADGAMLSLARDPEGRDLAALLGADAWAKARKAAAAAGIDIEAFRPFEPWYVALLVSQLRMLELGFNPAHGIEAQLLLAAQEQGKAIEGLETLADQLGSLDGLSLGAQREFLLQTLSEAAEIGKQVDGLLAAWRAGDEERLEADLLEGLADQNEVYERVVVNRNERFARVIADLADDSRDYLVVMGSLHLVGEDGVPSLLEARGLKVRDLVP